MKDETTAFKGGVNFGGVVSYYRHNCCFGGDFVSGFLIGEGKSKTSRVQK